MKPSRTLAASSDTAKLAAAPQEMPGETESMKAFVARALKGLDSLVIEDVPAPGPLGPGQIRVAMRAASLNYRDLLLLSGALSSVRSVD
jgi:hypothetical protein